MAAPLTTKGIEAQIARLKGTKLPQVDMPDDRVPNLKIRIGPKSATWTFTPRLNGQRTRVTLGRWPGMGISEARDAAHDARRQIDTGVDLNAAKRAKAAEEKAQRSLKDVLDEYRDGKLAQLRQGDSVYRALAGDKGLLRAFLSRKLREISRTDVAEAVKKHAKTSPIAANRNLAYARAFFNWCVSEELIAASPAGTVKKPAAENTRDRHHTIDELKEIWAAAGTLGYPFGPLYQLLMTLPMRREELAALPVAELDLAADDVPTDAVWTLPAGRTKRANALRVPLSPLARRIIKEALADAARPTHDVDASDRKVPNPFLFSTTGSTPPSGFTKGKRRLDAAIADARTKAAKEAGREPVEMEHWTLHDLRTSFTTLACDRLGIDPAVADRCLNHTASATTSKIMRTYNRSELFEPRKAALNAWASLLETEVIGGKPSNVVPLRPADAA